MLSLADINLGYAGRFPEDHAIHRRLAALKAGESLHLAPVGEGVELHTEEDYCVAKLSAKGIRQWHGRLNDIAAAKIIGMVRWLADSGKEEFRYQFRYHCKVGAWEVPLVELRLENPR